MQVDLEAVDTEDVEFADAETGDVKVTGVKVARVRSAKAAVDRETSVVDIGSDSDSSSSSSDTRRSRSRSVRNKRTGAAAATALLTSHDPLDIDEAERVIVRELVLPTRFAAQLQCEGGAVAIMVEMGVDISVLPREADPNESALLISGTRHSVGRAAAELGLQHAAFLKGEEAEAQAREKAKDCAQVIASVELPSEHAILVLNSNGALVRELRAKCGGLMIALQPSEKPGGPLTVFIGPGDRAQVAKAEQELHDHLLDAECEEAAAEDELEEEAAARAATATAAEDALGADAAPTAGAASAGG